MRSILFLVTVCACLAQRRKVFLLGQTGVGKSAIGNYILDNQKAFKPAKDASVCSTTSKVDQSKSVIGGLDLTIFDTPGLGDTQGRSVTFLDDIMDAVIREKPHGLIFFINGANHFTAEVQHAFHALAHCVKPQLDSTATMPAGRTLLVVNQLRKGGFGGGGSSPESLAQKIDEMNTQVSDLMKMTKLPVAHTFGFKVDDQDSKDFTSNLLALRAAIANLPDTPMPVHQFRPYRNVLSEANNLLNSAVSAEKEAQRTIDTINGDIGWHEKRIHDLSIAKAATAWIPFVNIGTTIGFEVAIADSRQKIPQLKNRRDAVQRDKNGNLANKKAIAQKWKKEVDDLKNSFTASGSRC